jgi:hypothetical protein
MSTEAQERPDQLSSNSTLKPAASTTRSSSSPQLEQVNLCRSYSRACCPAGERRLRNVSSPQFGQRGLSSTPKSRVKPSPRSSDITLPPAQLNTAKGIREYVDKKPHRRENWRGLKFFLAYGIYVTPAGRLIVM